MSDQLTELACDLRERALTYTFLARALSDEEVGTAFLESLRDDPPQTGTALDGFAASLAGLDADGIEQVRKDVAADHSATLLGMSARPVSPFESVWVNEANLMMQAARDEVVHAYAVAGFGKSEDYHMPEDHISLELDFMAGLGMRAATRIEDVLAGASPEDEGAPDPLAEAEADMNAQFDFLEKHLCAWVPAFCDKLESHAKTDFYRGVAQMLRVYVADEKAYLEELEAAKE